MKRNEFMGRLAELLNRLPESERKEAIQYYEDYFADAGVENEDEVVDSLGTPEAVAESILQDFDGKSGEYTECGYTENEQKKEVPVTVAQSGTSEKSSSQGPESQKKGASEKSKESLEPWAIALIIIAIIVSSPIWMTLLGSLIGVIASVIGTVIGVILAFAVTGLVLIAVGIALAIFGFSNLLSMPMGALSLVGIAIFLVGLGVLSWLLTGWLIGSALPFLFKQIARFFKWLGRGCRKEAAVQ